MLDSGGIKLSTCQTQTSKLRGCVDAGLRGIPHVARFIQPRIELTFRTLGFGFSIFAAIDFCYSMKIF